MARKSQENRGLQRVYIENLFLVSLKTYLGELQFLKLLARIASAVMKIKISIPHFAKLKFLSKLPSYLDQ